MEQLLLEFKKVFSKAGVSTTATTATAVADFSSIYTSNIVNIK